MILAEVSAGAFERQNIQRFFDNTDHPSIALGGLAHFAKLTPGRGDVETFLAKRDFILQASQRFGEIVREGGIGA